MITRYLLLKNNKIIGYEASVADAEASIRRDFRIRKQDLYELQDLESNEVVCVDGLLRQLRIAAAPQKEIKFPPQKERKPLPRSSKPIARSTKPIARTPIARSTRPIARTPIVREPVECSPNKPFVQPDRKAYKRPKPGRNDIIDDKFSAWLGTQPCVITGMVAERGAGPYHIHCHHIRGRARGKRNDHNQVPLMGHLHTYANHSYHVLGKNGFLEKWKDHMPDGVDDIVEYFESRAKAFKAQYDAEVQEIHLIAE